MKEAQVQQAGGRRKRQQRLRHQHSQEVMARQRQLRNPIVGPRQATFVVQQCLHKGRITKIDKQLRHAYREYGKRGQLRRYHAHQKGDVVASADALVQPLAVVVETFNTLVAHATMLGLRARGAYVADMAQSVLDDMWVAHSIKVWLGADASSLAHSQLVVGWIDGQRHEVRHAVQKKKAAEHKERRRAQAGTQRRHQHRKCRSDEESQQ